MLSLGAPLVDWPLPTGEVLSGWRTEECDESLFPDGKKPASVKRIKRIA